MRYLVALALVAGSVALAGPTPSMTPDIPATFVDPKPGADFERRVVMIPMRDGVKLHTVIVVPKGAKHVPMILTRTPYNADKRTERENHTSIAMNLPPGDDQFIAAGWIRVFQDIRGKYGSEGDYVMTRPLRGPLNDTAVDHSTDAYDTIDWLVKNVPESNGKVGMVGSSYEGFTVLMALVHPHPALKAAVPMCPMVDGWRGDDWFHNGAFRQVSLDYFTGQTSGKGEGKKVSCSGADDYEAFRNAGSTGDYARANGLDQLPFWKKVSEHPAYDAYWQGQALDKILVADPPAVPTMFVDGQWDQEDMYGGPTTYEALAAKDPKHTRYFLVLGPWRHSGQSYDGTSLGSIGFDTDTALAFRRDLMFPFLASHLADRAPAANTAPVTVFETGTNAWRRAPKWPLAAATKPLYLRANGRASFDAPPGDGGFDEYMSDPAKPVPYVPRPVRFDDGDAWKRWLVSDQRAVADRPDVLVYTTDKLTAPVHIAGAPAVGLYAATTGGDADWVVKLIDVYPDSYATQPELGGYQLPIGMDIFRGRYRESFEHPAPITPNRIERYQFALPNVDHVFLPGHRIMIQIQSSWFPLYDRNPQTYVDNIFFAKPTDYQKQTMRVYRAGLTATAISLPVVP